MKKKKINGDNIRLSKVDIHRYMYDLDYSIDVIHELNNRFKKHARARADFARVRANPDESLLSGRISDNRYKFPSKLNCCPYTHVISKYIPALAKNVKLAVPCGKCAFCLHRKQNAWIFRAFNHAQFFKYNFFVTLTFDDIHYPDLHDSRPIQLFLKRFRKANPHIKFSYFACGEYGKRTHRFHYHLMFFTNFCISSSQLKGLISASWQNGFVHCALLNNKSITYVTKYSCKDNTKRTIVSKHFGEEILSSPVWYDYFRYNPLVTYQPDVSKDKFYTCPVPLYYKKKVLTDAERTWIFSNYLESSDYINKLRCFSNIDDILHYYLLFSNYVRIHVDSRDRIDSLTNLF